MIILENEYLKASIAAKGAELQSLYGKQTNIEYLWNADAKYWGKHSPVLFPIVGSLKENQFSYQGKTYTLPRHGFARDHVFQSAQISAKEAVFSLSQNEETLKIYPFNFELKLRYKLNDRQLSLSYEVSNTGDVELLFSLGAHPAFAVPNTPNTVYEDYYLDFNKDESLTYWKLEDGLVADETVNMPLENHQLKLRSSLFYQDALVFKDPQSNRISLLNNNNTHGLHFDFNGFPFFGIWAAIDAPFICLEPWCGVADGVSHNMELKNKEGINALAPKESWQRSWQVECF